MSGQTTVAAAVLSLSAVIASADVRVDYDRSHDFSRYRTFSVEVGPLVDQSGAIDERNTLAQDRLRQAVSRELAARGLEPAASNADLVVRVSSRDRERTDVWGRGLDPWYRPWRHYGYFGYRRWRDPFFYDDVWTRRYLEGSMTVDVTDGQTDALVYRARVTEEIGDNPDKYVRKALDKAFDKFPVKEADD
jgi:hypothetical protein